MNRIAVVLVDRANLRMLPLIKELRVADLHVICCGSMVLDRFHHPVEDLPIGIGHIHKLYHEVEGSNKLSMVNSMAMLMPQLANLLDSLDVEGVVIIGDRYETLAVAQTVTLMGKTLIHLQGGEQSGNIDEFIRHAITKLAHYHIPATQLAKRNLIECLGEEPQSILEVGCPTADFDVEVELTMYNTILCIYHPETGVDALPVLNQLFTEFSLSGRRVLMLWPNIDPGSNHIHKWIRRYIEKNDPGWLEMRVHFDVQMFQNILSSVGLCVGNSSSFIRDSSFYGTPCLILGGRQINREHFDNVKYVKPEQLKEAIAFEFGKRYARHGVYGTAGISKRIAKAILNAKPKHRKSLYDVRNYSSQSKKFKTSEQAHCFYSWGDDVS